MISVHDRSATKFEGSGLGVLDREIINPTVTEELGGQFCLTFTYPADGPAAGHLVLENIVAASVPGLKLRQGFRISEVATSLEGMLEVTAFHVFYDLAGNFVADTFIVNKTAKAALGQLLGAANTTHNFTATSSDMVTRASARIVRMSLAGALMDAGEDNTFASRWGGEIIRDNWHIHHTVRRGTDRGVVIRDRKNLTGFESALDFSTVATRIVPVGYDGLLLPELYVDSPKINDYYLPRIKVIRYGQVKAIKDHDNPREDELPLDQAHAELRRLAAAEFSAKHVDEPSASYKVRFVDLAATREYADFAELETVELGDTVTVRHTDLDIALTARVVAYEYNPLALEYVSIELGSLADKFTSVTRHVKTAMAVASQAQDVAGFALTSADGKNTNHYGPAQPATARLGDTWFRTNGERVEIWIYQVTDTGQAGWVALATDLNHAQISAQLEAARKEVEQATTTAVDAKASADSVSARLTAMNDELSQARTDVQSAKQAADTAQAAAHEATTGLRKATTDIAAAKKAANAAEVTASKVEASAKQIDTRLATASAELASTKQAVSQAAADVANARKRADDAYTLASTRPTTAQVNSLITASADTKNTITYSSNPPLGAGSRIGDTWWQQADGQLQGQWQWDGKTWQARKLRHEIIASIDTGTLVAGNTRMGKAVVERIVGDAAAFGVLAANKIVVGDASNLWRDQHFTATYQGWSRTSTGYLTRTSTGSYVANYYASTDIPVSPGEKYSVTFDCDRTDPNQSVQVVYRRHSIPNDSWPNSGAAATLGANETTVSSKVITVPENVDALRFGFALDSGPSGVSVTIRTVQIRRLTPAVLIEDGAITAEKIAANAITAGKIQAGALTSDKLTIKNGFITNAMIANAAITDAKINSLSAAKITTGYLAAARIAAGSITSDKLTIKDGFITNAMIANAQITDAKIASLSAAKITTGTLSAARIAAGSITSDKLTIKDGFITNAMIANAAVTDAKIGSLSAAKITAGTLSAARIAAGSITSDKLTIANGFITNAMIANAAVTSAKIAALDAGKITTGYLNAARIRAGSITADKFATNAIQVGLAGWTSSIRITPYQVAWYDEATLQGRISSNGMEFYYGDRYIGRMGESYKDGDSSIRGITMQLSGQGDFVTWSYRTGTSGAFTSFFTLDPKGLYHPGVKGIHLGTNLRTHGWTFYTSGNRGINPQDASLTGKGTFPAWSSTNNYSKVVFATNDLYLVTRNTFYNMTSVMSRIKDLMGRVNTIINLLNHGWITSISGSGSNISWQYYSNTGYQAMSTTLT